MLLCFIFLRTRCLRTGSVVSSALMRQNITPEFRIIVLFGLVCISYLTKMIYRYSQILCKISDAYFH